MPVVRCELVRRTRSANKAIIVRVKFAGGEKKGERARRKESGEERGSRSRVALR